MLHAVLLLALAGIVAGAGQQPWGYAEVNNMGPSNWKNIQNGTSGLLYPDCALTKQSPVNLRNAEINEKLSKLNFMYTDRATMTYAVENTQHSQKISFNTSPGKIIDNNQGGKRFSLQQFHFHSPSEHSIGGGLYDLEMHLVHTADTDNQPASAAQYKSEFLVVGIMFAAGQSHNSVLNNFWSLLPELPMKDFAHYTNPQTKYNNTKATGVRPFNVLDLLPASPAYYTYDGSFTTPPCTEGVKWYVMHEVLHISTEQLAAFRKSMGFAEEKAHVETTFIHTFPPFELFGNNRPVQPLNGRKVESFVEAPPQKLQQLVSDDDEDEKARGLGIAGTVLGATALVLALIALVAALVGKNDKKNTPYPEAEEKKGE